jgi:predicted ATPase
MGLKITKKPSEAKAEISKEILDKGSIVAEEHKSEVVHAEPIEKGNDTPWCEVGFEAGYTHNLGNYRSARAGVSLVIPCKHGEINGVYEFAKEWVNARLTEVVEELVTLGE